MYVLIHQSHLGIVKALAVSSHRDSGQTRVETNSMFFPPSSATMDKALQLHVSMDLDLHVPCEC